MTALRPVVFLTMIAFCLVIAACTPQAPAPPPDTRAQDEAAIRKGSADALAALKAGDFDKLASFYTADAVAMFSGSPMVSGREQIKQAFQQAAQAGVDLSWTATKVEVARSGDLAVETGTFQETAKDARPVTTSGHYVVVLRKQADGTWLVAYDIGHEESAPPVGN